MKLLLFTLLSSFLCILASNDGKIKYTYTLWIGNNIFIEHSLKMESDDGIFFIDAMNQAAAIDSNYIYESITFAGLGEFITKIGGYANDPDTSVYWMLYNMTKKPHDNHPPADNLLSPLGVSSLKVEDKHDYLFWLRTVEF